MCWWITWQCLQWSASTRDPGGPKQLGSSGGPKTEGSLTEQQLHQERTIILTKVSILSHRPIKSEGPSIGGLNSKELILKHCSIRRPLSEGSLSNSPSSHKPFHQQAPKGTEHLDTVLHRESKQRSHSRNTAPSKTKRTFWHSPPPSRAMRGKDLP